MPEAWLVLRAASALHNSLEARMGRNLLGCFLLTQDHLNLVAVKIMCHRLAITILGGLFIVFASLVVHQCNLVVSHTPTFIDAEPQAPVYFC